MLPTVLLFLLAAAPNREPGEVLEKIKSRALDNLRALPNYTCTATIERSGRHFGKSRFENIDRIRLEIAYVGGNELFGWPAGERIAEADLRRLIGGTITNGDFALVTRAVFGGDSVVFRDLGRADSGGRSSLSGEFAAPQEVSDWVLAVGGQWTAVAYRGSFRADAEGFGLIELRMAAEHIPSELGYRAIARRLQFQPVRIGSQDFLLPSYAELLTTGLNDEETRNETRFANCRQYIAESVIRFEVPEPEVDDAVRERIAEAAAALPDEFEANLELESAIDSETAAVGDPISARVTQNIAGKTGGVGIPKGATLRGRISRLDVASGQRYAGFAFTRFEWGGRRVEINGRENRLVTLTRQITGVQRAGPGQWSPQTPKEETARSSGPIRAYGTRIVLPRGYRFILESRAVRSPTAPTP